MSFFIKSMKVFPFCCRRMTGCFSFIVLHKLIRLFSTTAVMILLMEPLQLLQKVHAGFAPIRPSSFATVDNFDIHLNVRNNSMKSVVTLKNESFRREQHHRYCQYQKYILERNNRRRSSKFKLLSSRNQNNAISDAGDWKVGNFKKDAQNLRMAIAKSRAEDDLNEKDRIHLLDEFAKQRKLFFPDLVHYVFYPLLGSIVASSLYINLLKKRLGTNHFLSFLPTTINIFSWVIYIYSPLLLFITIKLPKYLRTNLLRKKSSEKMDLDMDYFSAQYDYKIDPRKDCSDYIMCLLENWSCSVLPYAITVPLLYFIYPNYRSNSLPKLTAVLLSFSQMINRLGCVASHYQFPKLLYQLQRDNQPRPIPVIPTFMQQIITTTSKLLPYCFVYDFVKVIHYITNKASSNSAMLGARFIPGKFWKVLFLFFFTLSFLNPMIYLVAYIRLIKVQYFTNISLTESYSNVEKHLQTPSMNSDENNGDGFNWRYKLKWREPRRLSQSIKFLWRDTILFFLSGWGDEDERSNKHRSFSSAHIVSSSTVANDSMRILDLVQEDMETYPNDSNVASREAWIKDSFSDTAKKHQESYDKKEFDVSTYYTFYKILHFY